MKNLLRASLMTALVAGLMAVAGSGVRAATITFTTTGTWTSGSSGTGSTGVTGNGTATATVEFGQGTGQLLDIRFNGASQTANAPPPATVSLGIFQSAFTGTGTQSGTATFTLNIIQTSPSAGGSTLTGSLVANVTFTTSASGGGTVTFSTSSTTIDGVTYSLSNSGVVSISVPQANNGTFTSPGNSVEATVTAVPEPASMLLLGTGLLGAAGAVRRRFKARS